MNTSQSKYNKVFFLEMWFDGFFAKHLPGDEFSANTNSADANHRKLNAITTADARLFRTYAQLAHVCDGLAN